MKTTMFGRGALHPVCTALVLLCFQTGARAADLRVCVDSASPTAGRDKAMAEKVASQAGLNLTLVPFDGSGGDDGFPLRKFRELLTSKCELVMGYPVDATGGETPPGLLATKAYAQTGFVLVDAPGTTAKTLSDLPAGTDVAVTFQTAPNLYFVDHGNISADVHTSDSDTMQAIATGAVKAAMLWQPTVEQYESQHHAVKLQVYPLDEPHARYNVVALYLPRSAPQAETFNATKIAAQRAVPDGSSSGGPPALYTQAQATQGYGKFLGHCAMCHGAHLEGRSGPSLKGPNWANEKADYKVGEVFTVVSQQMPATAPASLDNADYEQIMAYLLQQNGYPAGPKPLVFDKALSSTVPLRWHAASP